jgi:hypothetical protein
MNIVANIIACIHLLFVIFVVTTPFITDNPFYLLYYCFIIFFVGVHWYFNNDTCVLTMIEAKLRGTVSKETFMSRLLKPIYIVKSNEIKYITGALFLYALLKTRLWEKDRYDYVSLLIYTQYKLISNRFSNKYKPPVLINQKTITEPLSEKNLDIKQESISEIKSDLPSEIKPELPPEVNLEVTPEVKLEVTPEVKLEVTPEVKLEVTPEIN